MAGSSLFALIDDIATLLAPVFAHRLIATRGTAATIAAAGIPVAIVNKVTEGRPHIVDMIKNKEISLIINTADEKRKAISDSRSIRTSALAARSWYSLWRTSGLLERI